MPLLYVALTNEEGFTIDAGLSAIRQIAGEETAAVVETAQKFCANKPALRAWLDGTTMGSTPRRGPRAGRNADARVHDDGRSQVPHRRGLRQDRVG